MRRSRALVALVAIAAAGPAGAGVYSPDPLTVSGRFEAPKAVDGPLKAQMQVTGIAAGEADALMLGAAPEKVQLALASALNASLRNFGYANSSGSGALKISARLLPFEVAAEENAVSVIARFAVEATGPGADCVPKTAEAKYRALAPMKAFGAHRTAVWITVIGLAAVGLDGSQMAAQQLATASASDAAVNGRRERTEFEGVAPQGGDKALTRYAAVNATQLANADLIRQLGKGACPTGVVSG